MLLVFQAARLVSPLRDAWTPGGEDDRETQQTVARMLAEIKQGGEEAGLTEEKSEEKYFIFFIGLQKLCQKTRRILREYSTYK